MDMNSQSVRHPVAAAFPSMRSAIMSLLVLAKAFWPMQFNGNQERGDRMSGDLPT
jgi:hypothetical protein